MTHVVDPQGLHQDGLNSLFYNGLKTPIIIAQVMTFSNCKRKKKVNLESVRINVLSLLAGNTVFLVLNWNRNYPGCIYPCIKFNGIAMYWELTILCHFKVIMDGQTVRQTDRRTQTASIQ